jgi:hypothetical protein
VDNSNQFQGGSIFSGDRQQSLPNATAVLVLGIISIVTCFCYGIPGLVCGIIALMLSNKDLKLYNAMPDLYTSDSYKNLKAGRVCAIVGTILSGIYVLIILLYVILIGTVIFTDPQSIWGR